MMKKLLLILLLVNLSFAANTKGLDDRVTQFTVAQSYANGKGVKKDYEKAVKWYSQSAEQGFADAQYHLGIHLYSGKGVKKDYEKAAKWIKKAALQGNIKAQHKLGILYYNGQGIIKSYKEAAKWVKKSYESGNTKAKESWKKYELWKYE